MPCKDGRQCLREIRANKKYDAIPIIMYTSLNDLQNIEFCYREGSNLYAIKPHTISELKTILEQIFTIDWKNMLYFPPRSRFVLNPQ
jgi:CheY-like chemotaxis protein